MIRKTVFEQSGETLGEGGINFSRCPGEECPSWRKAAGNNWLEKSQEACDNCSKCGGNYPLDPNEKNESVSDDLVEEIQRLILLADCGILIDWENKDFLYFYLFQIWRGCEKEVENLRHCRMQAFLKVG